MIYAVIDTNVLITPAAFIKIVGVKTKTTGLQS
jgi:hypothetical protein